MSRIKCLDTGLIYKNPKPHVKSLQASFPSVVVMQNGEMLASVILSETFEAVNVRTHVARSTDQGQTWQMEGPIYPGTSDRLTSDGSKITSLPDGSIVGLMARWDRSDHPDEGLTNHANMGFAPTELLLLRSQDYGRTWTEPRAIAPPLIGPSFELCCPVIVLRDGRWILPTQTWRRWDGYCPNGTKMVALISHDQGTTWPNYVDVMSKIDDGVLFFESKIVEFSDGALLAAAWAHEESTGKDWPNQYALSKDGGQTWSEPASNRAYGPDTYTISGRR